MSGQMIVTASLEGMRVVADGKRCELHEDDFQGNRRLPKEEAPWPLPRPLAYQWLTGWNHPDRFAEMGARTKPPHHTAAPPGRWDEPRF
jgi:hypothetical protein